MRTAIGIVASLTLVIALAPFGPAGAASSATGPSEAQKAEAMDIARELRGLELSADQVVWFQAQPVVAPDGTLRAAMDWGSLAPTAPVLSQASLLGFAGCVTNKDPVIFPWANDPPVVGACLYQLHAGGIESTTVVCLGDAGYCITDGLDYGTFSAFFIFCPNSIPPTIETVSWPGTPPGPVGTPPCFGFLFGANPTTWTSWDSICGLGFGGHGLDGCLHRRL